MRALVVSTLHPNDPSVFQQWVARLRCDGWDVVYAAPFAEHGVPPHDGLTGLDLPTGGVWATHRKVAAGMLRHRGPEADLVVVSSQQLAGLAPRNVAAVVASTHSYVDVVDRSGTSASHGSGTAGAAAPPSRT